MIANAKPSTGIVLFSAVGNNPAPPGTLKTPSLPLLRVKYTGEMHERSHHRSILVQCARGFNELSAFGVTPLFVSRQTDATGSASLARFKETTRNSH